MSFNESNDFETNEDFEYFAINDHKFDSNAQFLVNKKIEVFITLCDVKFELKNYENRKELIQKCVKLLNDLKVNNKSILSLKSFAKMISRLSHCIASELDLDLILIYFEQFMKTLIKISSNNEVLSDGQSEEVNETINEAID